MSSAVQGVYFVVSLTATLLAASVFADRLDRLGERLGLPEALLGLLTAAGADAPELAAAVTALVTGAKGTGLGVVRRLERLQPRRDGRPVGASSRAR